MMSVRILIIISPNTNTHTFSSFVLSLIRTHTEYKKIYKALKNYVKLSSFEVERKKTY